MSLTFSRLWIALLLLIFGCNRQVAEKPAVVGPGRVSLSFPEVSLRWLGKEAGPDMVETTIKGSGETVFVSTDIILGGDAIEKAVAIEHDDDSPAVMLRFTDDGTQKIFEATKSPGDRRMAVVVDGNVVLAAKVNSPVQKYCSITGRDMARSEEIAEQIMELIGQPVQESESLVKQELVSSESNELPQESDPAAVAVIDQALAAIGGLDAVEQMSSGVAVFQINNKSPGAPAEVANATITVHYQAPHMDRREIQTDPDSASRTLLITNGDRYWEGNEQGIGKLFPGPSKPSPLPPHMAILAAPFTIGTIGGVLFVADAYILKVEEDEDGRTVVAAYSDTELRCRLYFDKVSHLPVQIVRSEFSLRGDEVVGPIPVTTWLTDYKQFGPALLPSRVVTEMEGAEVKIESLLSVDFESTVDSALFQIPE